MDSEGLAIPLYFTWSYPVAWQRRFEVMVSFIGTVIARGQNDNENRYQQQKRTKKDGQKMTDYQKSFGGTRRFKIVEPIYYMCPV